jgi:hypothetical protein
MAESNTMGPRSARESKSNLKTVNALVQETMK